MMSITGLRNPYSYLPLQVDKYYGPISIYVKALQTMGGPTTASMNITGLSGMGKSHLLRHLSQTHILDVQYFSEPYRSRVYLLFPILVEYTPQIDRPATYTFSRYIESFELYKNRLGNELREAAQIELLSDISDQYKIENVKDRKLYAIYEHMSLISKFHIRPIFLLDDLDLVLKNFEEDIETFRLWRTYASIIASSEVPLSSIDPKASAVFGIFNYDTINSLSLEEAKRLLWEPIQELMEEIEGDIRISLPDHDVLYLIELCGRHPSLLILGGKHLWNLRELYDLLTTSIPLDNNQKIILRNRIAMDYRHRFEMYWEKLNDDERKVISTIVQGGNISLTSPHLINLAYKGLVYVSNDGVRLFSTLFEDFIRETGITNREINLTGKEAKLYSFIKSNSTRICYFDEIWDAVWGEDDSEEHDTTSKKRQIQVTVHRINKRLQPATTEKIIGVRGVGYRLSKANLDTG